MWNHFCIPPPSRLFCALIRSHFVGSLQYFSLGHEATKIFFKWFVNVSMNYIKILLSILCAPCLSWANLVLCLQCLDVLLATQETHRFQEGPARPVSVIHMVPCLSPVTLSLGSALASQDSRGGSVLAVNIGMRAMARNVFVRILMESCVTSHCVCHTSEIQTCLCNSVCKPACVGFFENNG